MKSDPLVGDRDVLKWEGAEYRVRILSTEPNRRGEPMVQLTVTQLDENGELTLRAQMAVIFDEPQAISDQAMILIWELADYWRPEFKPAVNL